MRLLKQAGLLGYGWKVDTLNIVLCPIVLPLLLVFGFANGVTYAVVERPKHISGGIRREYSRQCTDFTCKTCR